MLIHLLICGSMCVYVPKEKMLEKCEKWRLRIHQTPNAELIRPYRHCEYDSSAQYRYRVFVVHISLFFLSIFSYSSIVVYEIHGIFLLYMIGHTCIIIWWMMNDFSYKIKVFNVDISCAHISSIPIVLMYHFLQKWINCFHTLMKTQRCALLTPVRNNSTDLICQIMYCDAAPFVAF